MKKILPGFLAAFFMSAFLTVSVACGADTLTFPGEVNTDTVNIRSDSTVGAETICQANKGERVEVVRELYDWYKIKLPAQAPSFIKKDFVTVREQGNGVVTVENANIRLFPTEASIIVGKADKDEPVTILGESAGWYKIKPVKNSFGWVHKKFVTRLPGETFNLPQTASPAQVTVSTAKEPPRQIQLPVSAVMPKVSPPKETIPATPVARPSKVKQVSGPKHIQLQVSAVMPKVSSPKETMPAAEGKTLTIEGLLKSYGHVINRAATHKLIARDKKEYLLQYDQAALNNLMFHTVRITGKLVAPQKRGFPVIEVEKIEALD